MRHRILSIPLTLLATLALAATVMAGGWATVAMTEPAEPPAAGASSVIELTVLQHGETAVSWPRITVVATNNTTGEVIRAEALPSAGQAGMYTASLTFPTDGAWALTYTSPDLVMEGSATLAVPAAPAPIAASNADPGLVVALGGMIAAFLLVFGALVLRDRRADRAKQPVTVGS
ncbi:MAG TPA: hypothetical protein VIF84_01990 [Candidatus Limnocylindrales bacterium]|jgi:hypothetical protein